MERDEEVATLSKWFNSWKIVLELESGNVIIYEGGCSYGCHIKQGRKACDIVVLVSTTESTTLQPRSRTTRGRNNRIQLYF
jgi:hypothetical protein